MNKEKTAPKAVLSSFARTYNKLGLNGNLTKAEYQKQAKDCLFMAQEIAESIPAEP
jgi:hypothetical protein